MGEEIVVPMLTVLPIFLSQTTSHQMQMLHYKIHFTNTPLLTEMCDTTNIHLANYSLIHAFLSNWNVLLIDVWMNTHFKPIMQIKSLVFKKYGPGAVVVGSTLGPHPQPPHHWPSSIPRSRKVLRTQQAVENPWEYTNGLNRVQKVPSNR